MKLIKAFSGLAIVNAVSQIIQFLAQPVLTRLYSPEEFGILAQITVISTVIAIFGTLQIHNYLVLAKNERELQRMVCVAVTLTTVICIAAFFFLLKLAPLIYGSETHDEFAVLTCLFVMTICYGSLIRGIQTFNGDFKRMMSYIIIRSVILIVAQFLLGLEGVKHGLIYGLLLGEVGAQVFVGIKSFSILKNISISEGILNIKQVFRTQKNIVIFASLQELIAVAVFMLPLYLISRFYGNMAGGQFAIAHKIAWTPILFFAQSISPVFMKYASNIKVSKLRKNISLNLLVSFLLFLFLSGLSLLYMKPLFMSFFDERWRLASDLCALIGVFSASYLCAFPYRICFRILNKQQFQLFVDAVSLIFLVLIFSKSHYFSLTLTVQAVVIVGVVQNIFAAILAKYLLCFSLKNNLK